MPKVKTLLVCFYSLLLIFVILGAWQYQKYLASINEPLAFSSADWLKGENRWRMAKYLVKSHLLTGKSEAEVVKLLGFGKDSNDVRQAHLRDDDTVELITFVMTDANHGALVVTLKKDVVVNVELHDN